MKPKRKKNYSLANLRSDRSNAIRFQKTLEKIVDQQLIYSKVIKQLFGI